MAAVLGMTLFASVADAGTWDDQAGDNLWSSVTNWDPDGSQATLPVIFDAAGAAATAGTVTSILDSAGTLTIASLRFQQNGAALFHTLQINAGSTLLVNGTASLKVGVGSSTDTGTGATSGMRTAVTITGGGALQVDNVAGNIEVGMPTASPDSNPFNQASLNLAGLGAFTANVNQIRVGYGLNNDAVMTLSNTANNITANLVQISESVSWNARSATLNLGNGTNVFNVAAFDLGIGKGTGTIKFAAAGAGTVVIGGKDQAGTNMRLGVTGIGGTGATPVGTMDLRNHVATVMVQDLVLGRRTSDGGGGAKGEIFFNSGTFSVANALLGDRTNSNTGRVEGILNISGGTFTVEEGGSFVLADNTGVAAANVTQGIAAGTVNLTGGTFITNVDIVDGGGTSATNAISTFTLNGAGAVVEMMGNNFGDATNAIDNLNLQAGTLRNVGEINGGTTGLTKSGAGTLVLDGNNTYTGGTTITGGGVLQVGTGGLTGNLGSGGVTITSGVLAFNRSNTVTFDEVITGSGDTSILRQMGAGRTIVTANSLGTYNGRVEANNGVLQATNYGAAGNSSELVVAAGGEFHFASGAATSQPMEFFSTTLAVGSTLGVGLGDTIDVGNLDTAGSFNLKLFGNPALTVAPGGATYTLLSGADFTAETYTFRVYNPTNFVVTGVQNTGTAVQVNVVDVDESIDNFRLEFPELYWEGGTVPGASKEWAAGYFDGMKQKTNWSLFRNGGTDNESPVVPGASVDAVVAVDGVNVANLQGMSLGADMTIKSLSFGDIFPEPAEPVAISLVDGIYQLTIVGTREGSTSSIFVDSSLSSVLLDLDVALLADTPGITTGIVGDPTATAALTINGRLSGNGFTKDGFGTLTLGGVRSNTYTGAVTILDGLLLLNKTPGFGVVNITEGLIIGRLDDGGGGGNRVAQARLLQADQIADTSTVEVNTGSTFDLNGNSDTIDVLSGGGLVTNGLAASLSTLTVGGGDGTGTFSGVIQNGLGTTALTKIGTGVQTLSGVNTYTGQTTVLNGTLQLGASGVLDLDNAILIEGAGAILDLAAGTTNTVGQVRLRGGSITGAADATLASAVNFELESGTVSAVLGGATGINKTTTGAVFLSGANTFTGNTIVTAGTLTLQAGGSIGVAGATAGSLRVGDASTASFIGEAGSSLSVGSGSSSFLHVGVRTFESGVASVGTLDLSAMSNFTANVGSFLMGVNIPSLQSGSTQGIVRLAENSYIRASTQILMGDSNANGNSVETRMELGSGLNTFSTPLMTVGGRKSNGLVTIAEGGTWVLNNEGGTTTLYVARNNAGTGVTNTATMNLTGGTFIANLGLFSIGDKSDTFGTSGGANGFFISGTSELNNVQVELLRIGSLGIAPSTTAGSGGRGEFTWNGGLLEADEIALGVKAAGLGTASGVLTLNGGTVVVNGNISDGGGTSTVVLNGAILDMTGGEIGSVANPIDTLLFQSGTLRNVAQINGGTGLTKTGPGVLYLGGVNAYTGATAVNAGTLWVTSATGMGGSTDLTIASGATFNYSPGAGQVLQLSSLSLAGGSAIGGELGNRTSGGPGTVGGIDVNGTATFTGSGSVAVNVFGISGFAYTSGQYDLVTADGGLAGVGAVLGNIYNATNFTVTSVGSDADSIFVNIVATAEEALLYWKGGYAGGAKEWSVSNGVNTSNWTRDEAGTINTSQVPGASTDVIFSTTNAAPANQTGMTLGADMTVGSILFQDADPVSLDDTDYSLTLAKVNALTVAPGAGEVTLRTTLAFSSAGAVINVADAALLELAWRITGANGFTKTGGGTLVLSGSIDNDDTGTVTVSGGLLQLAKGAGFTAIAGDLEVGSGGTVLLESSGQIADTSDVTLAAGGELDLNGNDETIDELTGGGLVTNGDAEASVLTVGAGDGSFTFSGDIEDGTGGMSLVKDGSGTMLLGSQLTYTGLTTVVDGVLRYGLNDALVTGNDLRVDGADAVFDLDVYSGTLGTVTLANGSITGQAAALLTSNTSFELMNGLVTARLAGSAPINKTTTGTVTLAAQSSHTGGTFIRQGTLVIGVTNALPTDEDLIIGDVAGTAGGLTVNEDQTLSSLRFRSNTAAVNTVTIAAGKTLLINGTGSLKVGVGSGTVGDPYVVGHTTNATFSGPGALVVDNEAGIFEVGIRNADQGDSNNNATLDLRDLGSFTADVDILRVAYESKNTATLRLSNTSNTITANLLSVGNSSQNNAGADAILYLGTGTNIIRTTTLDVGRGKTPNALMAFGGAGGTLTLGGKTVGSLVNINVGVATEVDTGAGIAGTLDLSAGTAYVSADILTIGRRTRTLSGGATGRLRFADGTFTVNQILLGSRTAGGAVSGVLDIQGGEFTVNAGTGNSFVIGEGASATGLLSITGGVFTSNVDIEDGGEGTSRITLDGGELDLVGNEIGSATNNINELNFISGVLSNVAAINGTGGVTKTGAGETLKLEGTNTYTGATLVTAGTFLVNGTHTGGAAYTVNAGTTLGGGGNITLAANQSVNIGGRLAVGDSTLPTAQAATLTITTSGSGALVFQDDSFVEFDLITAGTGALNSSDLLDIDGALTIGSNVTLDVANPNNLTNWAFGDTWQLFDWTNVTGGPPPDESLVVGGSFADILDGTGFTWDFTDLYIGGTVSIVPEPGRAVLLLLGVGALVLRRRRSSVSSK